MELCVYKGRLFSAGPTRGKSPLKRGVRSAILHVTTVSTPTDDFSSIFDIGESGLF